MRLLGTDLPSAWQISGMPPRLSLRLLPALLILAVLAACASGPSRPPARKDVIRRGETPLTLVGRTVEVGQVAPDATLHDAKLAPVRLADFRGKTVVLSVVPSIDTRVCEAQTHHVSDAMPRMPADVVVMTVSRDLPFAQERFAEEAMTKTLMGSDYRGGEFGRRWGLEVEETGLLARSVWVIGPDGKVRYRELVADQTTEPDIEALVTAVNAR
jgi:thiol peroxidase